MFLMEIRSQGPASSAAGEPKHSHCQNKIANAVSARRTEIVRNLSSDKILNTFPKILLIVV